jgi:cytochrome c553
MQKKVLTLTQLLVFILSLALAGGMSIAGKKETATDTGPDEMILKTATARKAAKFPHRKHQKAFECGECHHSKSDDGTKYPYVDGMEIKKCVVCHNKDEMNNPKLNNFKLIAHALCKECHKKNKDKAPTRCSGCHIK